LKIVDRGFEKEAVRSKVITGWKILSRKIFTTGTRNRSAERKGTNIFIGKAAGRVAEAGAIVKVLAVARNTKGFFCSTVIIEQIFWFVKQLGKMDGQVLARGQDLTYSYGRVDFSGNPINI